MADQFEHVQGQTFHFEELSSGPGQGCVVFILGFILSLAGYGLLKVGHGWKEIAQADKIKGEVLQTVDVVGPWVMMGVGLLLWALLAYVLYQFFSSMRAGKQKPSASVTRKFPDQIEIQPLGIIVERSSIRALRLTMSRRPSPHRSKTPDRFRWYRLYFELTDGSLIHLTSEMNSVSAKDNLRLKPVIPKLAQWMGNLPFHDISQPLAPSDLNAAPEIRSLKDEGMPKHLLKDTDAYISLNRPMAPFSWLFWIVIPLVAAIFIGVLRVMDPPLVLHVFFYALFSFIFLMTLTHGELHYEFDGEELKVRVKRFLGKTLYRTASHTLRRGEVLETRLTVDDNGTMLILKLAPNAPSVPWGMQMLEYTLPERCGFFDGPIFVALSGRHGTVKMEEIRRIQKRINQLAAEKP